MQKQLQVSAWAITIMRISFTQMLIAALFMTASFAEEGAAQNVLDKKITVDLRNTSLRTALTKIEKVSDAKFLYHSQLVSSREKISLEESDVPLSEVLDRLLNPLNISYEVTGNQIVLTRINNNTPGESGSEEASLEMTILQNISGIINDENGVPLPGVNIVEKGTTNGTTSDILGKFNLSVQNENSILVFSFIGYQPQEMMVGSQTNVSLVLLPDITSLSEIVVIGYGEKSRKLLTESIGTVGSKEIQTLPVASADAALQGRISGVQITNGDGTPGAPVAVRVRGVGSVSNVQPLFVIDGIPVGYGGSDPNGANANPLSTINPNDIESISVLKDASSAAVYGVRAAHGVVLITTKRGKLGNPRFNFDATYGIQNFPKTYDLLDTRSLLQLNREAINNKNNSLGLNPGDTGFEIINPELTTDRILDKNTDWQNASLNKNAPIQNYNISVSGGDDKSNYFISGGYFNQEATTQKYNLDRYSIRANSDHKVGTRFKFGQTFSASYQETNRGGGDGGLYATATSMPPYFDIYDVDNEVVGNRYPFTGNFGRGGLTILNIIGQNEIIFNTERSIRLLGGMYGELEIIKGLKFKSAGSLDYINTRNSGWQPAYSGREIGLDRLESNFNDSRGESSVKVFTNTLTYQKSIADHTFNILAGMEYQENNSNGLNWTGYNFISSNPGFYSSVANGQGHNADQKYDPAGSNIGKSSYLGYFGRLSYDYKQKYLVTATVRNDRTSNFAPENRSGIFPSVSAAWRLTEEQFLQGASFISELKLRASWGQLGSDRTTPYPHVFRSSTTPDYGSGETSLQAPAPVAIINRNIKWERVETTDFGFDIGFFDNSITLLATYYYKNTKDFLYSLPISRTSGFGSSPVNAGNVVNKGVEIELGYNKDLGNDFKFNISGNITTVKNELTSLSPGILEFSSGDYRTQVGQPIGYFYGYKTDGIYQNQSDIDAALPDNQSALTQRGPGDIIFVDTNGSAADDAPPGVQFSGEPDGRISPEDRTYLGKTIPDFFYGLNVGANFKGLDIAIFFQGVGGVQAYNQYRRDRESISGPGRNLFPSTLNRWTDEGTSNTMPRAVAGDPNQNNRFSDRWIENAGFLRLKNVQVGYSLPKSILERTRAFTNVRVFLSGTNLLTFTDYTGLDPEVVTNRGTENQLRSATDNASIPQPRTFQAGLQLQF